jgi:hypothetical protein
MAARETHLPIGPDELLAYFERVSRENSDPHWRNAADLCRRWTMLLAGSVTQEDIDRFLARLDSEPRPGTGWTDLGMQFRHWARGLGLNA